jgi:outer membrane protein TolC
MKLLKLNIILQLIIGYEIFGSTAVTSLTLQESIGLALKNHTAIQNSKGIIKSAKGSLVISKSAQLPQLQGQAQAQLGYPSAQKDRFNDQYTAGVSLQQLMYDFNRTGSKISSGKHLLEAAIADSQNIAQTIILSTISAYFSLAQAKATQVLYQQNYQRSRYHLQQAIALLDAGRGIRYSVVRAQIDTSSARLNIIKGNNLFAIAKQQLENTIDTLLSDEIVLTDSTYTQEIAAAFDSAYSTALTNRKDLHALQMRVQASEMQLKAISRSYYPSVTASGTAGYRIVNNPVSSQDPMISGAITLSIPLFTGGAIGGAVLSAEGALESTRSMVNALKQSIELDLKQQIANYNEVLERIALAKEMITQSELALSLAKDRFAAGSGNYLEVIDAENNDATAKLTLIQSHFDQAIAAARLQKATGLLSTTSERNSKE